MALWVSRKKTSELTCVSVGPSMNDGEVPDAADELLKVPMVAMLSPVISMA